MSCTTQQDVEIRMDAISRVLRHEHYRIVREEMVTGCEILTTRVVVTLTINGQLVNDVPFLGVQAIGVRRLVQEVDLEHVMTVR